MSDVKKALVVGDLPIFELCEMKKRAEKNPTLKAENACYLALLSKLMVCKYHNSPKFSITDQQVVEIQIQINQLASAGDNTDKESKKGFSYLVKFLKLISTVSLSYKVTTLDLWVSYLNERFKTFAEFKDEFQSDDEIVRKCSTKKNFLIDHGYDLMQAVKEWAEQRCLKFYREEKLTVAQQPLDIELEPSNVTQCILPPAELKADHPSTELKKHGSFQLVDESFWKTLQNRNDAIQKKVLKEFYWFGIERHAPYVSAWQPVSQIIRSVRNATLEVSNTSRTILDVIQQAFDRQLPTLIKISAPIYEGKTALAWQLSRYYSTVQSGGSKVIILPHTKLKNFDDLKDEVEDTPSNIPILLLVDTPYFGGKTLLETLEQIIRNRNQAIESSGFVTVMFDQPDRFNKLEKENELSSIFDDVIPCRFKLGHEEVESIKQELLQIPPPLGVDEVDYWRSLSIALSHSGLSVGVRIRLLRAIITGEKASAQEWESWRSLTVNNPELTPLFRFVALFSYLGYSVPLLLFNEDYLPGVKSADVSEFLSKTDGAILQVTGLDISLGNGLAAAWFYEDSSHIPTGISVLDDFIRHFNQRLDDLGCRVLRNINKNLHRLLKDDEQSELRLKAEIQKSLENYCDKNIQQRRANRDDVYKTNTVLSWLEKSDEAKLARLDASLRSDEHNAYAVTRKINVIVRNGIVRLYPLVEQLIQLLYELEDEGRYYFSQKYWYEQSVHDRLPVQEFISALETKRDFMRGFINTMRRVDVKCYPSDVRLAADYLFRNHFEKTEAVWLAATLYAKLDEADDIDRAIDCFWLVVEQAPHRLPPKLQLSDLMFKRNRFDKKRKMWDADSIERLWRDAIAIAVKPMVQMYTELLKLYRSPSYISLHTVERALQKAKEIFDDARASNTNFFETSFHFRTEYAKWCYDGRNKLFSEAIGELTININQDPYNVISYTELGKTYKNKYDAHKHRHKVLNDESDLDLAFFNLEKAIEIDELVASKYGRFGYNEACRVLLAKYAITFKRWPKARKAIEKLRRMGVDSAQARVEYIKMHCIDGEDTQVREETNELLEMKDVSVHQLRRVRKYLNYHYSGTELIERVDARIAEVSRNHNSYLLLNHEDDF